MEARATAGTGRQDAAAKEETSAMGPGVGEALRGLPPPMRHPADAGRPGTAAPTGTTVGRCARATAAIGRH